MVLIGRTNQYGVAVISRLQICMVSGSNSKISAVEKDVRISRSIGLYGC
jgi:hypothetical protein